MNTEQRQQLERLKAAGEIITALESVSIQEQEEKLNERDREKAANPQAKG